MVDQRLINYIKKEKTAGRTDEQIKSTLLANGWKEADMMDIFKVANVPQPPLVPQPQDQSQVQPQPQYQAQSTQNTVLQKRKKNHLALKFFIVLIIIVVLGGGGLFFTNRFFNFPWNFFRPAPESVILKAWNNLKAINSENFNSEFSLSGKIIRNNNEDSVLDIVIKTNGGADIGNELALIKTSITASIIENNASNKYSLSLSGEARLIQKDLYLKLDDVNLGGLENILTMFGGPDIKEIKGRWIRIVKIQSNDLTKQQAQTMSKQQINAEQVKDIIDKIVKTLLDKKVYDITQLKDNQGIDGKEYHYYISLNREKMIDASTEIFNILKDYHDKYNPGQSLSLEYTLGNFQKILNDIFDKVGEISADLFIGKKDNFFHKIQFAKDLDISKFNNDDYDYSGIIKINYKIEKTGINKPIQISPPDKYEDLKDIISSFIAKMNISQAINQASSIAQQICSTNKSCYSLCKNGLLNTAQNIYGKKLTNINSAIIDQGGTIPICFSNTKDYCISTQLKNEDWLCSGKDNKLGKTKCISAKTVCQ